MTAALGVSRKTKPFDKVFKEFPPGDAQRLTEVVPRGGRLLLRHWGIRSGCSASPAKVPVSAKTRREVG